MKTKITQLEAVEQYCKKTGSVKPSHFSIEIEGRRMSVESLCRHLRTLRKAGVLEQSKDEHGRVEVKHKPVEIFVQGEPLKQSNLFELCAE